MESAQKFELMKLLDHLAKHAVLCKGFVFPVTLSVVGVDGPVVFLRKKSIDSKLEFVGDLLQPDEQLDPFFTVYLNQDVKNPLICQIDLGSHDGTLRAIWAEEIEWERAIDEPRPRVRRAEA